MADKILSEIGEELPTALVNRMVIGKNSIDVEILVKDQLDEQLTGTWFNNEKLGDLLKMVVVMSKSPEATEILSLGSDAVGLCDRTVGKIERESLAEEVVRLTNPQLLSGTRRGLSREKRRILNLIDKNTEVKILNLSKDFKGSVEDIIRSEKQEIEGIEISNIYYDVKFALEPDEDHASIFSYVKMDIRDFGERFSIDTSRAGLDSFNGEISAEKVIASKLIVRRSRVFFRNGRTYNGSVRYSFRHGRYFTDLRSRNSRLETRVIRNPKVIDEREVMSIAAIRTEFDNLSFAIASKNKVSRDNMESNNAPSYFSPLIHSKDEDDNVRFMFSVNTSEILTRNSIYGPLFSRLSFSKRQDILERSILKNIEVRRVRVKTPSHSINRLNSEQMKGEIFDKDEPPVTLCRTGEKEPRSLSPINRGVVSFSEEDTYFRSNRNDISMRTFSGIDKSFSSISDGFYQYEVDIEVSDTIQEYLTEQISELKTATSILKEYYNFGILTSPTLERAEISNPHIDLDTEAGSIEAPDKSHYEAYSNKFTRRFSKEARNKYQTPENYPWVAVPPVLVDLVSGFTSDFPEEKKVQIVSSMRHSMSPITGHPTNILAIIKMIASFTRKVEDLASLSSKPSASATASTSSTNKEVKGTSKSPTKSFTASKRFEETFNSNNTRSFGFNYFDPDIGSASDLGLKKITNFDYEERVDEETERYFVDKDVDINLSVGDTTSARRSSIDDASYGYLTPVSFLDKKVLYDFTDNQSPARRRRRGRFRRRPVSQYSKMNSFSFLLESIVTDSKAKDVLERNSIFSDELNITIAPVGRKNFSYYPDQRRHRRTSFSNMQDQVSVIELYDYITKEKSEEPNSWSRSSFLRGYRHQTRNNETKNPFKLSDVLSRPSRRTLNIKTLKGETRNVTANSYVSLPNQLKAIFLRKAQNNNDVVTGEFLENMSKNYNFDGALEYKFTIGKLARIRYLVGYGRQRRGRQSAKSPQWRILTKRIYDRFAGKSIVCKIDPYSDSRFGYTQTPGLDTNIYNEYFILDIQRDVVVPDMEGDISADGQVGQVGQDGQDGEDGQVGQGTTGQPSTQGRDRVSDSEDSLGTGAESGGQRGTGLGADTGDTGTGAGRRTDSDDLDGRGTPLSSMTPQQIAELDLSRFSDEDISNLNALQLASVPLSRRNRLARRRTRFSRNNLMCVAMADENESEEFRGANARTSVVPNRSMRQSGSSQGGSTTTAQSGDVY